MARICTATPMTICEWSKNSCLTFNIRKTQVLRITCKELFFGLLLLFGLIAKSLSCRNVWKIWTFTQAIYWLSVLISNAKWGLPYAVDYYSIMYYNFLNCRLKCKGSSRLSTPNYCEKLTRHYVRHTYIYKLFLLHYTDPSTQMGPCKAHFIYFWFFCDISVNFWVTEPGYL